MSKRKGPYYINPVSDHPDTLGWEIVKLGKVYRYVEACSENDNRPDVVAIVARLNRAWRKVHSPTVR